MSYVTMLDVDMLFSEDYLLCVDCELPSISLGCGCKVLGWSRFLQVPWHVCTSRFGWSIFGLQCEFGQGQQNVSFPSSLSPINATFKLWNMVRH